MFIASSEMLAPLHGARKVRDAPPPRKQENDATPAMMQGVSLLARTASGETDPCIPIAPVTFSVRGAVIC